MGLFDWKNAGTDDDDEDQTVTLIGYATPEFEENLRGAVDRSPATCVRCGESEADHCSDCGACYGHAGWCPSDPDNIKHAQESGW